MRTTRRGSRRFATPPTLLLAALLLTPAGLRAHDEGENETKETEGGAPGIEYRLGPAACTGGRAGEFACRKVDLLAAVPVSDMGGARANDIWGWTDPATGRDYALVGLTNGVGFVDVSDPERPRVVGRLPSRTGESSWRDLKVYEDHVFVVSEATDHGLQVFDLTRLRKVDEPPVELRATATYTGFGSAHNLAINEQSGFAYAVGAGGGEACNGGLHIVDISRPRAPSFAGCFANDGYTHDVQCVMYRGPDADHTGKEICFAANEDTLTVVDVTDKELPVMLARAGYSGAGYVHQGWLTPDQRFFLADDELDEDTFGHPTRTYVWNVQDLDAPRVVGVHDAQTNAIDHNQYIRGRYTYQANYRAGLRILKLVNLGSAKLREEAYFDVYPADDEPGFNGAWSVYPYFASGVVVVSSIESGLFVLRPQLGLKLLTRVSGVATDHVKCRDQTDRRTRRLELDGETSWNCRDSGLALTPGNRLRQDLRATATGAKVSGSVAGLSPFRVRCRNLASGQRVEREGGRLRFNCTDLGLEAAPGDPLLVQVWADVD